MLRILGLLTAAALSVSASGCSGPSTFKPYAGYFPERGEMERLKASAAPATPSWRVQKQVRRYRPVSAAVREAYGPARYTEEWSRPFVKFLSGSEGRVFPSAGMRCLAEELGRFVLEHQASPTPSLENFLAAHCGVSEADINAQWISGESSAPAGELVAHWSEDVEEMLERLAAGGSYLAGFWFGQREGRSQFTAVVARRRSLLRAAQVAKGQLVVRGEALDQFERLVAMVTQGDYGYARCERDRGVAFPQFAFSCPLDGEAPSSWVQIVGFEAGRFLGSPIVHYLHRGPAYQAEFVARDRLGEEELAGSRAESGAAPGAVEADGAEVAPHATLADADGGAAGETADGASAEVGAGAPAEVSTGASAEVSAGASAEVSAGASAEAPHALESAAPDAAAGDPSGTISPDGQPPEGHGATPSKGAAAGHGATSTPTPAPEVPADFNTAVTQVVNAWRARAGLSPVSLDMGQSASNQAVAPHYFASVFGQGAAMDADWIALGLMAGWDVDGTVVRGDFSSGFRPADIPAQELVESMLQLPFDRETLLNPKAARIAIGELSGNGLRGVLVTSYELFAGLDRRQMVAAVLEELNAQRAKRGLQPVREDQQASAETRQAAVDVEDPNVEPNYALAALRRRVVEKLNSSVVTWTLPLEDPEDIEFPESLLTAPSVRCGVSIAFYRDAEAPWGQYYVLITLLDPGRSV